MTSNVALWSARTETGLWYWFNAFRWENEMPPSLTPQDFGFSIGQVSLNLALAFALAYLAASFYRKLHVGPSSSRSFFLTLVVTPVVVAMIIMAIGSNIALSLGLVGALSIIRFRTVIKDTRDMSFLFLAIGIGLCCGSGTYALAVFGTIFACLVVACVHYMGKANFSPGEYILVFRKNGESGEDVDQEISSMTTWSRLHSVVDLGEGEGDEFTYRVHLESGINPSAFIHRLKTVGSLTQPSLITPESQLAI